MKKLLLSGLLLFAVHQINAQSTMTNTTTTHGLETGQQLGTNVHVGFQAGKNSAVTTTFAEAPTKTIKSDNTFVGYQSGFGNTEGVDNVYLGFQTGVNNGIGKNNNFIGSSAGSSNTNGSNNVFNGFQAGYSNLTGSNNTFTGYKSGFSTTTVSGNSFYGYQSGTNNTSGVQNTFVGTNAGFNTQGGHNNVYIGHSAGYGSALNSAGANTFTGYYAGYTNIGSSNSFYGFGSGKLNTTGFQNAFIGAGAGAANTTGWYNTYLGCQAGYLEKTGYENVFVGHNTGFNHTSGDSNVFIGDEAGFNNITGGGNVFIGNGAGRNETGSGKFYVATDSYATPLIFGDFTNGKVGIGGMTSFPTNAGSINVSNYKLFVTGGILTEEVRVHLKANSGWADYVFGDNYKLPTLTEVEKYIVDNGHLPNVPSAKQIKEDGLELGQMANIQQEKIEELTLYAIEQNKQIEAQKSQLEQQQKEIDELKAAVKVLMAKQ